MKKTSMSVNKPQVEETTQTNTVPNISSSKYELKPAIKDPSMYHSRAAAIEDDHATGIIRDLRTKHIVNKVKWYNT